MTDDILRQIRVGLADLYRILKPFFIFPHLDASSFPRPGIVDPGPIVPVRHIRHEERAALGLIGLDGLAVMGLGLTIIGQSRLIGRMGIQEQEGIIYGKARSVYMI